MTYDADAGVLDFVARWLVVLCGFVSVVVAASVIGHSGRVASLRAGQLLFWFALVETKSGVRCSANRAGYQYEIWSPVFSYCNYASVDRL